MRNLKKVLSLALAMVMLLGMMVVGAGAASFTDDADITHKEAVAVVSGIGVLQGVDDGSKFNPEGTLTRAEAAVVIAKLDLGAAFGNLATTNASTFKDVGTGYGWAKPYIDYCAARGLIAGDGNGYFKPGDDVTGVEFALMVARVLGYEDANESISGPNWEVNAAAVARKAGLTVDVTLGSTAIPRDDMAQVAFNALKADMVEYDGRAITIGDVTIPAGKAEPVKVTTNNTGVETGNYAGGGVNIAGNGTKQLCEEKFPKMSLNNTYVDDFDRTVSQWTYDGEDIFTSTEPTIAPVKTYTSKQTEAQVGKDLKGYGYAGTLHPTVNGREDTTITIAASTDVDDLTGNGRLVEIYTGTGADAKEIQKIIVVDTYVGDVTRVVPETDTRDAYVTITSRGKGMSGNFETSAFEKDDVVLYTYSSKTGVTGVKSVVLADTVDGTLERFSNTKGATVDGTTYPYAYNIVNAPASGSVDKDVTLVLDTYGNVLDVKGAAAAAAQYAFVIKASSTGGGMYNDTFYANLLLADGTKVDVQVKDKANGLVGKPVTYTVKDDVYTLTDAQKDSGSDDAFELTRGSSSIKTATSPLYIRANGSTIFFVRSADDKYDVYTGIASVPTIKGEAGKAVSWVADVADDGGSTASSAKVAKVMYIDARLSGVKSESKDLIFVYNNGKVTPETDSDGTFYEYPAIINGEETIIKCENATNTGLYDGVVYNSKGIATSLTASANVTHSAGTKKVNNDTVGIGSAWFTFASDVSVFYVNTDGTFLAPGIDGVTNDETDDVWFVLNSNGDVSAMFIKQVVGEDKALQNTTTYTVAGDEPVEIADGTATLSKVAIGDVITVQPKVSGGATVTSCQITGGTATNKNIGGSSYTVVNGDAGKTIEWTVTIVSESGVSDNTAKITLTLASVDAIKSLTVTKDPATEGAANVTQKLTGTATTSAALFDTGADMSGGTLAAALAKGDKVTVSAAVGSGAKVKSVVATAADPDGVNPANVSGGAYTAPETAETGKKAVYTVTVTDAKNADVPFTFTLTTFTPDPAPDPTP